MAEFEINVGTESVEEAIRQMQKADLFTNANVKAMLETGADVMLGAVKSAFVEAGHANQRPRRTGQTLRHFTRQRSVKKDKNGVPYMQVTINGKDSRGQRYAVKGFVLNYGRRTGGKIPADFYWSNAKKAAWPRVNAAMSDKAAEIINR